MAVGTSDGGMGDPEDHQFQPRNRQLHFTQVEPRSTLKPFTNLISDQHLAGKRRVLPEFVCQIDGVPEAVNTIPATNWVSKSSPPAPASRTSAPATVARSSHT